MTLEGFVSTIAALSGLLFVVGSVLGTGLSLTIAQIVQPLKNARLLILAQILHLHLAADPHELRNLAADPAHRSELDTTAAEMLVDLDEELNAKNIHLAFAELQDPVKDKIVRYGLLGTIDSRHFYPTLEVAVEEFNREARSDTEINDQ